MVESLLLIGSIWLAALAKLHSQGLSVSQVGGLWSWMILLLPAVSLPYLGSSRSLRKKLVEPEAPYGPLYALGVLSVVAVLLGVFGLLSWGLVVLANIPLFQLLCMRGACALFFRGQGRLPRYIRIPGMTSASIIHTSIDAHGKPRADRLYTLVVYSLAVVPFFSWAFVSRPGA